MIVVKGDDSGEPVDSNFKSGGMGKGGATTTCSLPARLRCFLFSERCPPIEVRFRQQLGLRIWVSERIPG